ncbi:MAG: DNA-directed RNA polymerase subunit A'' [Candidatus Aenigmarchaeota archaeon]|nr:DNA-directed RNA polymerase subunit A'' [Candidatus Aenigmarchaeota archaeon]
MRELPVKIRKEVEEYAEKNKVDLSEVMEKVKKLYNDALYYPEEAMGVVAAQSLSEPATQMTMRTYHFAGTAGIQVTLGLPRLIEIYDAKKEPETPSMTIYLNQDYQTENKAMEVAKKIKEVKLRDFVVGDVIDLINLVIRLKLDMEKLGKFGLEIEKLKKHIKIKNVDVETKGSEVIVTSKKMENINLHKLKYKVMESHIRGVKGISHVIVSKDEMKGWIISTLGSNLKKILEVEGVNPEITTCNNIFEIYDVLGVEAARNAIIIEAIDTIEEQGLGVDPRYVSLLADLMTSSGSIMGIGRYGVAGNKDSVLARMAFEETKKHIITAAIEGIKDPLKGHVENIIMNQVIPVGTGAFQLIGRFPGQVKAAEKPAKKDSAPEKERGIEKVKEMEKIFSKKTASKPAKKETNKKPKKAEKPAKKPNKATKKKK